MDGVDLMPFLTGTKQGNPHETFFWRQGKKTALRQGEWKLINMRGSLEKPKWELYHLGKDPTETNDLSSTLQEKVSTLSNLWQSYQSNMIPSIF